MTLRRIGKIDVQARVSGNDIVSTGFVFYSYAKNSNALEFHFKDQQGRPVDLLGTKVRFLLIVRENGEDKEFKTLDEEIVTESSLNGIVRYIIPDRLMGYQGIVDGWIYLDFPDGSKTDEVRFRFTMARSKIDEEVPLIQEFYVPQFEEMLESVKTDLNADVALAKSKINQSVTETQNVAQVEQGKIQEELPKIQTELSTINADIEAQKEKFEAASIYNKAEVDSKVADLDSVKADKYFVVTELGKVSAGIYDTVTSVASLNSKYPNGAPGNVVVLESDGKTGYQYTFTEGAWKKGAMVQAQGIAEQTVGYAEVKDKSLNYNSVDYVDVSRNRFNVDEIQASGYHNYTTGIWTSNANFDTSGKIPCRPGQVWTARYTRWVCYFDKNRNFKTGGFSSGGTDALKTFTIPDGIYYFEVSCLKTNTVTQQIELGAELSDFEEFFLKMRNLKVEIDPVSDIQLNSLLIDKMKFIKRGKNLFNPDESTLGYYVNPTTGGLSENALYQVSEMIPTYGNEVSVQGIRFYALYNRDGKYLAGESITTGKTITASSEHFWIRVSPTSGLEGAAQVEYGEPTAFEPYAAVLKGVKTESEFQSIPSINLPSTIYATANKELVIFKNNILLEKGYDFRWGRGIQGELAYRETFDQVGDKRLSIEIYREGKLITSKSVLVKVNPPRSTPITAMMIGDSTVASATTEPASEARLGYHMLQEMGTNLKLVGTRGIGTSKHEGRGGWTAKDYRSNKTDQTGTNPFYNPSTQDFDFAYYMENTNQDVPGLVFIQLGINDLFNYSTDEQAVTKADEFINDIKFIAANIKAYNSNIKIAYNIAIPPTEKIDVFAEVYAKNYNQPQWRYKRNNSLLAEKVIEELSSDNNLILNPIHKGINVFENIRDGVHPTDDGYKELASENVDFINGLN